MGWFAKWFGADTEAEVEAGFEDGALADVGYEPEDLDVAEMVGCEELNETSYCGNTGYIDCALCQIGDPDRGDPCIDCGNTGEVGCPDCQGRGYILVDGRGYGG